MGCFKFPIIHFPPYMVCEAHGETTELHRVLVWRFHALRSYRRSFGLFVWSREKHLLNFTTGKCCKEHLSCKDRISAAFQTISNISNLNWCRCDVFGAEAVHRSWTRRQGACTWLLAVKYHRGSSLLNFDLPLLRHGASSFSHFTALLSTDSLTTCMVAQKPETHLLPALCFWAAAAPQRGRRAARVAEAFQDCKT